MSAVSDSDVSTQVCQYYEVHGVVDRIVERAMGRNTSVVFIIKTIQTGTEYRLNCQFFCPLQEGDAIYAQLKKLDDKTYQTVRPPFVQVPVDQQNVIQCFVRALRGTPPKGFGLVSATHLYNKLLSLAKASGYGDKTAQSVISNLPNGMARIDINSEVKQAKLLPHAPSIAVPPAMNISTAFANVGMTTVTNAVTRCLGDGVIPYLSEMASNYYRTNNKEIVEALVRGTTLHHKQIEKLLQWWHKSRSLRRLHLLGLTNREIEGCKLPLDDIYDICMTNPYRLPAIEYDKCQIIMNNLGREPTYLESRCGKIVRKIYEFSNDQGWTGTPLTILVRLFPDFHQVREYLLTDYGVTIECNLAYLAYQLKVETVMTKYLDKLIRETATLKSLPVVDTPHMETALYECKTLTIEQKLAIQGALTSKICIITGGAGTGKTTIIRELVYNLQIREIPYITCAFTGKAVSRLQQVLKSKVAATLDRLISRSGQVPEFRHLIIDEGSMVTTELLYRFINTFPQEYRITIVGDINQLPPIGWGTLMKQMMISGRVPTYYLTQNHRIVPHNLDTLSVDTLPEESKTMPPGDFQFDRAILENANALVDSTRDLGIPLEFKQGPGFYQIDGGVETVTTIVKALYDGGFESDRIMAISPYNDYIKTINSGFQSIYHEDSDKHMDKRGVLWCQGDRVMMTKNNYTINVMNGTEGKVMSINDAGVNVDFGDGAQHLFRFYSSDPQMDAKPAWKGGLGSARGEAVDDDDDYDDAELTIDQIVHSYAVTVHKAQGSEREFVIFYVPRKVGQNGQSVSRFLNINLFYTGITRTQRSLWVVGDSVTIAQSTCNKQPPRHEALGYRLKNMRDVELEKVLESMTVAPIIEPAPGTSVSLTEIMGETQPGMPSHEDQWEYAD